MPLGPVEMLVVQFPGSEVKGDIVPAIKELVESGTIRVIDILFIKKDQVKQSGALSEDEFQAAKAKLLGS